MAAQDKLNDCNDAAQALIDWFKSQDIEEGRAVVIMSYLIGIMAAAAAHNNIAKAMSMLSTAKKASQAICLSAMLVDKD